MPTYISGQRCSTYDSSCPKKAFTKNYESSTFPIKYPSSGISFDSYYSHQDMNEYMHYLAVRFPERVCIRTVGQSFENRDIKLIHISNGIRTANKNIIFIDAGIHAREWIAPATALYIIYQLVENFEANQELLDEFDWIVLPLVNPDGYEYSRGKFSYWRKTRSTVKSNPCRGTDANRNFAFHWDETFASSDPCSDIFKGKKPFSEPESRIVAQILLELKGRGKFYISLHSFGNYILFPWGWTKKLPPTYEDLQYVASVGAEAIRSATGSTYVYGSAASCLYPVSGSSFDYAYAVAEFPISCVIELPGKGYRFHPIPKIIKECVEEAWIGIKAMAVAVIKKYGVT